MARKSATKTREINGLRLVQAGLLDLFPGNHRAVLARVGIRGGQHLRHFLLGLLGFLATLVFLFRHIRFPFCRWVRGGPRHEGSLPPVLPFFSKAIPASIRGGTARFRAEVGACEGKMGERGGEGKGWGVRCTEEESSGSSLVRTYACF